MSDEQVEQQAPQYGSKLAGMFGYVQPEDRSKWEQHRAQNKPQVGAAKRGVKSSMNAMMDFGDRNIRSKFDAAARMAAQLDFDETHDKKVTRHKDPRSHSIVENVDYEHKDNREEIEPDLGY